MEAYKSKNYSQFLTITQKLDSIRPSHPTFIYNLAAAYALNNRKKEAVSVLEKVVLMNNKMVFEEDADFLSLQNSEDYKNILELKLNLEKPIIGSNKILSLSEKDLHPESLLYLSKSKIWLASSIRKRKIISFDVKTGKCKDWLTDNGLLSVFAMKADAKEKYLWVTTSSMPEMEGFSKDLEGKAEVLKIDIKAKKIVTRFPLTGNHVLGDLVISKNGDVYVSDSGEAVIYKITNDKMNLWLDLKKEAFNLQGLTFNENQCKLFIADYLKGILVIPMKNPKDRKWLTFPKGATVKGIDGLVYYKNTLIAVHNGVKPIRLIQYNLDEKQDQIKSYTILDNNRPEFDEPALATVVNDKLYFFSNSPWKAYIKDFYLEGNQFVNPMLFQYELK
ncbi:TPR end-of-group domain-containing protein [Flavobacterium sp.]|uniref:TPR end-of-group domain-containing protein n=1 Tax=Flavobacterium sp. TaxID=239 RepID=UPI002B4B741D|nr:hypothetical protein [Flavobacterium sp.]HLF52655.1 hypothetical protein [Flavobacterium sp.]